MTLNFDERAKIADEILSKEGGARCDCGTDDGTHSPDCSWVRARDRAWADAGEILYERDEP